MAWFEDMSEEDRLTRCENKAAEIRKLLFGTLLLAKEIYKDDLGQKPAGLEVLQAIEEAEEDFVNSSLTSRFEKLEDTIDVILRRAKGIFLLVEYTSKGKHS